MTRIGITAGLDSNGDLQLRRQYVSSILAAGGVPIILPPQARPASLIGCCDGLLLSGGGDIAIDCYESSPMGAVSTYGAKGMLVDCSPERDSFELELVRIAYKRLPILGICRGLQVLNVALGGTLHVDIPGHRQNCKRQLPSHGLHIKPNSTLFSIIGAASLAVNSHHHQAAARLAPELRASAYADDGTLEALEAADGSFCIGVQWHPEQLGGASSAALLESFVNACRDGA